MKEKVLSEHFSVDNFFKLDVYLKHNGYQAVKKAITELNPEKILKAVSHWQQYDSDRTTGFSQQASRYFGDGHAASSILDALFHFTGRKAA